MIKRVYFVKAQQDNQNGGIAHSFRTIEVRSFFRPELADVVTKALNQMSDSTGLPFDKWCVDSFNRVA